MPASLGSTGFAKQTFIAGRYDAWIALDDEDGALFHAKRASGLATSLTSVSA
jgi:hypothetical protein